MKIVMNGVQNVLQGWDGYIDENGGAECWRGSFCAAPVLEEFRGDCKNEEYDTRWVSVAF
jgi:hypothetical protein